MTAYPMDKTTELKQLAELRDSGVLSESEFQKEKQRILNSPSGAAAPPLYSAPQQPPYGAPQPPPYGGGQMMMDSPIGDGMAFLFYLLSFLIPIAGFIIGAIYSSNNNPENQRVGKNCLYVSIATILIGCLCYCLMFMGFMGDLGGFGADWQCGSGEWIDSSWVNDGMCDCLDCSDEG